MQVKDYGFDFYSSDFNLHLRRFEDFIPIMIESIKPKSKSVSRYLNILMRYNGSGICNFSLKVTPACTNWAVYANIANVETMQNMGIFKKAKDMLGYEFSVHGQVLSLGGLVENK